ncbi:hypothetical protein BZG36_02904 [Bifiguratus adelaidae]|uniref:DNA polymerase n=1 Tax=Bifiguratus adelaidae TaxID=1938954 RepID=A0A261Y1H9_9FUNG|nr:hypothetical protein BZG36_02904 [Bifiguratus adelaidae]
MSLSSVYPHTKDYLNAKRRKISPAPDQGAPSSKHVSDILDTEAYSRPFSLPAEGLDDIIFQLVECEDASKDKDCEADLDIRAFSPDRAVSDSPPLRLFGCTSDGQSVTVLVKHFWPYCYFPISSSFESNDIPIFLQHLHQAIVQEAKSSKAASIRIRQALIIEAEPLMYYRMTTPDDPKRYHRFLKLGANLPTDLNQIQRILSQADTIDGLSDMFAAGKLYDSLAYEANLPFDIRFMVDRELCGGGFVRIKGGDAESRTWRYIESFKSSGRTPYSRSTLNVIVDAQYVDGLTPTGPRGMAHGSESSETSRDWIGMSPLRLMCLMVTTISLDTPHTSSPSRPSTPTGSPKRAVANGAKGRKKRGNDTVVNDGALKPGIPEIIAAISVVLTERHTLSEENEDETSKDEAILFTHTHRDLTTTKPRSRVKVIIADDEKDMLLQWWNLVRSYDPDIFGGYDTTDHIAFILRRAAELGIDRVASLTRIPKIIVKPRARQTYSASWVRSQRRMAGTSNREFTEMNMRGRWIIDMRHIIEREERLRTYSFEEAVEFILRRRKEMLDGAMLSSYWSASTISSEEVVGDATTDRARFLDYALKDVETCLEMIRKNVTVITNVEMARVTGLNFSDVINRGQMIRMWSQLFRFCRAQNVLVPTQADRNDSGMTEGPLNWMPVVGYNTQSPCIVLDFRSLYPSIIIAHNLCFSTMLNPQDTSKLQQDVDYEAGLGPQECYFVKPQVKKGILPKILEHFLSERSKVKAMIKVIRDPVMKIVLNGRQIALKVSANAMYGFTGAKESKLQCLPIAETTILRGAGMLEQAKHEIETRYGDQGFKVVYGDTDSVFVRCPAIDVGQAIEWGNRMSREISKVWKDPITLEFEKIYFPYMLVNRKRYAGLQWTTAQAPDKIDAKGIEMQRRDVIPLLSSVMESMLKLLFPPIKSAMSDEDRQKHIHSATEYVKMAIQEALAGNINVGEFVLTKGLWLGTEADDYKSKQAHVELVDRLRKRHPWREFRDGDRIPYVFIKAPPTAKGFEKSEDPRHVLDMGIVLDYQYYLRHQLEQPLTRILELLIPPSKIKHLFYGDHTKVQAASSRLANATSSGGKPKGLGAFFTAKRANNCLVCRRAISEGHSLCEDHQDQAQSVYLSVLKHMSTLGEKEHLLDSICRQCQGSNTRPIQCVNTDCSIFYRRQKTSADVQRIEEVYDELTQNLDW